MTKPQQTSTNKSTSWLLWGALALSLLWCLLGGLYLLDGRARLLGISANALERMTAADNPLSMLLAFVLPLLLFWSAVLLAVCIAELRSGMRLLSEVATRLARTDTEAQRREELQLQERLLQARQESAELLRSVSEEWRKLSSMLENFHEQGRLLRENSEEVEGILRETAAALPLVMERNLERLAAHLDDSREQIGILIRTRAEQESALSRWLADIAKTGANAPMLPTGNGVNANGADDADDARAREIPGWISAIQSLDVMARLRAMTQDIDAALSKSPSPSMWRKHKQGERGNFTPLDYTPQGLDLYRRLVQTCEQDAAFRERVDACIDGFEELLKSLKTQDQDDCLNSRAGKIHLLLAQVRGRFG